MLCQIFHLGEGGKFTEHLAQNGKVHFTTSSFPLKIPKGSKMDCAFFYCLYFLCTETSSVHASVRETDQLFTIYAEMSNSTFLQ